MQKSVVVTVSHQLGVEVARKRVAEGIEQLRTAYVEKIAHSEIVWIGDRADLKLVAFGQTTTARIDVQTNQLRIEVFLPWIIAALGGRVQSILAASAESALRIEHKPKS
ncbi:polyhydroxyalkanoic acid system family protein [Methylosinus sp. Sm6]|uniref:polyhydroxyalkanoic acid system family protein n=1 Tax=Methylosinus sp. Sm6 TaxID=2866948 RepID=UPI001C9A10CE|nr:polyhydroxyalkanoic acid system family protein [Methylosinus sp. Sm6]MBY6240198.1 polyhydroxyalkanoic acid system family protein [Methylosinus sp. Sm6]